MKNNKTTQPVATADRKIAAADLYRYVFFCHRTHGIEFSGITSKVNHAGQSSIWMQFL